VRYSDPALLDHLAAQYALGTLRGGARRRFERLMRDRSDVRMLVEQWHGRVQQLAVSVPSVAPSPAVWSQIERRIEAPAVAAAAAQAAQAKPASFWNWLKPAVLFAAGIAAGVAVVMLAPQRFVSLDRVAMDAQKLPQSYVGLLLDTQGRPTVLASSLRHGNQLTIKMLRPAPPPPGTRLVLWALPPNDPQSAPPFVLGVLPETGQSVLTMPGTSEQLLSKVQRLQVTAEPAGALPAAPGGPVVMSGHCVKLWEPAPQKSVPAPAPGPTTVPAPAPGPTAPAPTPPK
jgi:anti-sigma-K factor RskA